MRGENKTIVIISQLFRTRESARERGVRGEGKRGESKESGREQRKPSHMSFSTEEMGEKRSGRGERAETGERKESEKEALLYLIPNRK